jgi:uncharacterized protein with FMN-binding domain
MRRAVVAIVLTVAGLVPLLRYHPSIAAAPAGHAVATTPPTTSASGGTTKTVTGSEVQTEFGPYQVQATFTDGKLTNVQITETPSDRRSQRIASAAAPTLLQEALQAQSASIDTVSGATATSQAYTQSLQAAIDAKGN